MEETDSDKQITFLILKDFSLPVFSTQTLPVSPPHDGHQQGMTVHGRAGVPLP